MVYLLKTKTKKKMQNEQNEQLNKKPKKKLFFLGKSNKRFMHVHQAHTKKAYTPHAGGEGAKILEVLVKLLFLIIYNALLGPQHKYQEIHLRWLQS